MVGVGVDRVPGGTTGLRGFLDAHPTLEQYGRYAVVGGLGTLVNALIYLFLRSWWDVLPANLAALVISTLVSTEANRRFTFGGVPAHRWRARLQIVGTIAFYATYSSTVLLILTALVENPTPLLETVTVAAASVLGGAVRYLVLRYWVFGSDTADGVVARPADRIADLWRIHGRWALRAGVALMSGTALLLSSAGSCTH